MGDLRRGHVGGLGSYRHVKNEGRLLPHGRIGWGGFPLHYVDRAENGFFSEIVQ